LQVFGHINTGKEKRDDYGRHVLEDLEPHLHEVLLNPKLDILKQLFILVDNQLLNHDVTLIEGKL